MKDKKFDQLIEDAEHLYACLDRPMQALRKIEKALQMAPKHLESINLKGRILFRLDRTTAAMECFDRAIHLDPRDGEAFLERARIFYALKRDQRRALQEVKKAIKRAGHDRWVKVEALRVQGCILAELDQENEALRSYRAALKISPKDGDTHGDLGSTLLGMGQHEKALPHLEMALRALEKKAYPDYMILGLTVEDKAKALNALGRYQEALRAIDDGLTRVKSWPRGILQKLRRRTIRLIQEARKIASK